MSPGEEAGPVIMNETPTPEELIARVTVSAGADFLPPVIEFVGQTAQRLGLERAAAEHLDQAVEAVCRNVVEHAFGPGDNGRYDVLVLRRPGKIAVAVEDRGLPFDYARFQDGEGRILPEMLHRSFADEVRFINLGRGGNRVELVKELPRADVREH